MRVVRPGTLYPAGHHVRTSLVVDGGRPPMYVSKRTAKPLARFIVRGNFCTACQAAVTSHNSHRSAPVRLPLVTTSSSIYPLHAHTMCHDETCMHAHCRVVPTILSIYTRVNVYGRYSALQTLSIRGQTDTVSSLIILLLFMYWEPLTSVRT